MVNLKTFVAGALAAGLLIGGRSASAATYYVSTSGSDSNAGTQASPFLTIQHGVNAAKAGDTVIVGNGTYAFSGASGSMAVTINSAGTSGAWITLKAQTPGSVILDCKLICHSYIDFGASSAYWIISGFDIRDGLESGIWSNSSGAHNIQVRGNLIHNIGNHVDTTAYGITGIYTDAGASNWTIDGNVFHDVGRTSVLTGTHDHCIYSHGSNMLISNNVFYDDLNGWFVQTAIGFSGTIANNTFFGPNPYPGKVGQIVLWDVDGAVYVRNNIFYNPIGDAITNAGASFTGPCSIDHNIVYSATSGGLGLIDSLPSGCVQSNNLLNMDPKLTTPSLPNYNFQLLSGSPAIGAGVVLAAVPADFNGVSRAARDDLGAFQSGGVASAPPVISAVSATGIGASSATIAWTTNEAADSQVAYGPASSYGSATALNSTLTTSHSAVVTGLTAATLYHYAAKSRDAAGNLAASPDATFTTAAGAVAPPPPPPPGCEAGSGGTWQNVPLAVQTGAFTLTFDATPASANMDGVSGLSNGPASAFTALAAAVRFNNTGMIDARNGASYVASAAVPYVAGMTYHVTLVVNVPTRTYSAYVAQGSNAKQLIGSNYAFRTEQASATALNDFAMSADIGSLTDCAAAVSGSALPTAISGVSATALGQTTATIVWNTNNAADSQVQYGLTTSYGTTSTLNSTPVTSHSVALGGLTAGTAYHYRVLSRDASGVLVESPDATFTTAAGAPPPACATSSANSWQNVPLTAQTGSFTATFDATPSAAKIDGVAGLSNGPASAFTAMAAAVRFNNTGTIDARNGGAYAASTSIPYTAGLTYHFQLAVNPASHTYSAYVTQGANAQKTIGLNYAFRSEQSGATLLNNLAVVDDAAGGVTVCNVVP